VVAVDDELAVFRDLRKAVRDLVHRDVDRWLDVGDLALVRLAHIEQNVLVRMVAE
jgi:hypothetical protein